MDTYVKPPLSHGMNAATIAAGMVGPAACLCAAAWLGGASGLDAASKTHHAAFFVDLGLALSALTLAGVSVSHLDVAPRHAGLVFATGNTCATLAGAVAVPFSGLVLERTGQNWGAVFGIIAAVYVVGAAAWCACSAASANFATSAR